MSIYRPDVNEGIQECVCVYSPIVSVVWLAATRSAGSDESERWEEVEGDDRAVPFTLESV